MASNTKMNFAQKEVLRDMRNSQKDVKVANNGETTIAYRKFENTVEFALAVTSPDEKKFRAKVGEYLARNRFDNGLTVKMGVYDFSYMVECMFNIYLD